MFYIAELGNPLLPLHGLLLLISSKVFFYIHHPTDSRAYTTTFVIPDVEHWLEREITQWVHHDGSHHKWTPYHGAASRSHIGVGHKVIR